MSNYFIILHPNKTVTVARASVCLFRTGS